MERFRCTSEVQRRFLGWLGRAVIYLHSGNLFGKTTIGAAACVAMARGLTHLDGVALPRLPVPNVGMAFSQDYPAQLLSMQPAILRMIGDHAHVCEYDGEYLKAVRIKPDRSFSDDPEQWSVLYLFSEKNLASGIGARAHYSWFDEPPVMKIFEEAQKSTPPGCPHVSFITATPTSRRTWQPLRKFWPDPRRLDEDLNGFVRLQGKTSDNVCLTAADMAGLHRRFPDPTLRRARLEGEEIDTSDKSPFLAHYAELQRWLEDCTPGESQTWRVSREIPTEEGKRIITQEVEVEFWDGLRVDDAESYRIGCDLSLGIDDGEHDPLALAVWAERSGRLVGAYNGYLGAYGLGSLTAGIGRRYGNAVADPETGGGYAEAYLSGLRAANYPHVHSERSVMAGKPDRLDYGFRISKATREQFAASINEALAASQLGQRWLHIPCEWMVRDLLDVVTNDHGLIVTPEGTHDEGFILAGREATRLMPDAARHRVKSRDWMESKRGEVQMDRLRQHLGFPKPRPAPRVAGRSTFRRLGR